MDSKNILIGGKTYLVIKKNSCLLLINQVNKEFTTCTCSRTGGSVQWSPKNKRNLCLDAWVKFGGNPLKGPGDP